MKPIYRYVVDYARGHGRRVFDFGCGGGEVVEAARAAGLDMLGADVFYAGNDAGDVVRARGLYDRVVLEIRVERLPFPDATFDLVVSNQVLEHVPDHEAALAEIARVLRSRAPSLAPRDRDSAPAIPFPPDSGRHGRASRTCAATTLHSRRVVMMRPVSVLAAVTGRKLAGMAVVATRK